MRLVTGCFQVEGRYGDDTEALASRGEEVRAEVAVEAGKDGVDIDDEETKSQEDDNHFHEGEVHYNAHG